ncbi:MAG: hypothetical protein QXU32_12940 [Nitrososphaerales archaeon]
MQTGRTPFQDATISKPRLLASITIAVVAALSVPVILPHINHPTMIYHILLHVATVIVALFLSMVSIISYRRTHNARILLMTFGFMTLVAAELLHLLNATQNITDLIIPVVNIELSHIILLTMVTLFGMGVLKVNK